ncbi:hypothetical protein O8E95_002068 [Enterobacter quasiroggenkampii]
MKISKEKILNALKTTGIVTVNILKSKSFWLAVGSGVSFVVGFTNEDGNITIDPSSASNAEVVVHGVEAVVCSILNGCF